MLVYLNPNWKKEDGGALRLFPKSHYSKKLGAAGEGGEGGEGGEEEGAVSQQSKEAVDVYPEGGRLAMFYSADVAHEVRCKLRSFRCIFVY